LTLIIGSFSTPYVCNAKWKGVARDSLWELHGTGLSSGMPGKKLKGALKALIVLAIVVAIAAVIIALAMAHIIQEDGLG
jgi:hypothetical protein